MCFNSLLFHNTAKGKVQKLIMRKLNQLNRSTFNESGLEGYPKKCDGLALRLFSCSTSSVTLKFLITSQANTFSTATAYFNPGNILYLI